MDKTKNKKESAYIDFSLIRNSLKFDNNDLFMLYLKDIFRDLSQRDPDFINYVTLTTFNQYTKLPVFISEKLFASLDMDNDGKLDSNEFTSGLIKLYLGNFVETTRAVFNIYDFDKDEKINKGDVKVLLSYLPLKNAKDSQYQNQMESLQELDLIMKVTFSKSDSINFNEFQKVIESVKSDIYLQLLCFLYYKKPFNEKTILSYKTPAKRRLKKLSISPSKKVDESDSKMRLPSPDKSTKFKSTEIYIRKISSVSESPDHNSYSRKSSGTSDFFPEDPFDSPIRKISNQDSPNNEMIRMNNKKYLIEERKSSGNIDNLLESSESGYNSPTRFLRNVQPEFTNDFNLENNLIKVEQEITKTAESSSEILNTERDSDEAIKHEGWVYKYETACYVKPTSKIQPAKSLNKYYMTLNNREISLFKSDKKDEIVKLHNLSGSFIKENEDIPKEKTYYYSFTIIFSKEMSLHYFTKEKKSKESWVAAIKKVQGYQNFSDYYHLKEQVGQGKFGTVHLGIHKSTGHKVGVKIIPKDPLKTHEVTLVKTELDLMKLFSHENIVRLLDHFENANYIYIVMEYLSGGDLRSYLEKKNYNISEKVAAKIVYSIAEGVKYLNSYGIIHRDLKPENVMLTEESSLPEIKIIDFGLTKTLGPNERLKEGMGTMAFVAPEVLRRKPYNKQIDVWSLGVILYVLLSGTLPFTDDNEEDDVIAKKIVYADHAFPKTFFQNTNKRALSLIDECLEKNPEKRMTIERFLTHEWFQLFGISGTNK